MIEQSIRSYYQKIVVDPVANGLKNRISPNTVTWLSGLLGLLALPALYFNQTFLAIGLLLLSGYCDTLDGTLARISNNATDWDSTLDIIMDRLVEFTVVFALWSVDPTHRSLWCLLMLGSILLCVTSFLVVGIFTKNNTHKSFHYSPGLMERPEAFIFFILIMLLPNWFNLFAVSFVLLVAFTAVFRMYQFDRH